MTTQESEVDVLAVMLFDAESSEIGQRRAGVGEAAVQARMKLSDAARAAVAEVFERAEYLCRTGEGMIAFRTALRNAGVKA